MSGHRFVALIAQSMGARSAWEQASAQALSALAGFEKHIVGGRLALVAEGGAVIPIGRDGFVIGSIFERGRASALTNMDADVARTIVASQGDRLVHAQWGSYVAVIATRERDTIEVVRAPLGDLPCYLVRSEFGLFAASDVDLLMRFASYVPQVDWSALAQHLAAGNLHGRRTCLNGLDELSGGERLTEHTGESTIDAPWQPWDFTASSQRLNDPVEAVRSVRHAVQIAVEGRAHGYGRVLLRLSGGLDSSIVAACLKRAGRPFAALTLVTRDRGGDERVHARAVADHLSVPLAEATRDVRLVDLERSAARDLPRPAARSFAQASARLAAETARAYDVSAIFDGGGGDNMFGSLQSVAPAADCLRQDGGAGYFWRTARSIGIAAQTSTFGVARRALVRSWMRGPAFRWPCDMSLFSAAARYMAMRAADHPWLVPPEATLPGSAAHVALLAAAQSVVQSRDAVAALANVSPLIAQPVAEACLRVPGWLWTQNGHNRAIAREAFRDVLPPTIIDRRDKGAPDSFLVELIDANRDLVRAMLTEGFLAREGFLDQAALASALAPAALAKGFGYVRLMQLVDAEAWVRSWRHRARAG